MIKFLFLVYFQEVEKLMKDLMHMNEFKFKKDLSQDLKMFPMLHLLDLLNDQINYYRIDIQKLESLRGDCAHSGEL